MNSLISFVLVPVLLSAQPPAPPTPAAYPAPQSAGATLPGPARPGTEAYQAADLLARDSLFGTWRATYFEINGESRPDLATGLFMKFTRGRLELMQSGRPTIVVSYNVNPAKTPAGFVWRLPGGGVTFQDGIYSQETGLLTICLSGVNSPAATQFLTQPGDGRTLFVLERLAQ
jgi:uncharacterized protein (TIGR03067 family)